MPSLSLVVADPHRLVADAMGGAIEREPGFTVAGERPRTGVEALEAFARHRPDVVLIDYWLAEMNGPATTRQVIGRHPDAKIIMLGWLYGPLQIGEAREAGARSFFPKSSSFGQLIRTIEAVRDGWSVFPGDRGNAPLEWSRQPSAGDGRSGERLTPREIEILQLFCDGHTRNDVTAKLGIRPGTLKSHIHSVLTKMGTRTLVEAVTLARDEGVVRESGRTGFPWRNRRRTGEGAG